MESNDFNISGIDIQEILTRQ